MTRIAAFLFAFFLLTSCTSSVQNTPEDTVSGSDSLQVSKPVSVRTVEELTTLAEEIAVTYYEAPPVNYTLHTSVSDLTVVTATLYQPVRAFVLVIEEDTGTIYHGEFPFADFYYIEQSREAGFLNFFTELSTRSSDDGEWRFGNGAYSYNYITGETELFRQYATYGNLTLGFLANGDAYTFGECEVTGDTATLRFVHLPQSDAGSTCTEITLEGARSYGRYIYGFHNTSGLPEAFTDNLMTMDGVVSVEANYIEEPVFTGTQLVLTLEADYEAVYYFNKNGDLWADIEDFNIQIMALESPSP